MTGISEDWLNDDPAKEGPHPLSFGLVVDFLQKHELVFLADAGRDLVHLTMEGIRGSHQVRVAVNVDGQILAIYITMPYRMGSYITAVSSLRDDPVEALRLHTRCLEALLYMNWTTQLPKFSLDLRDGEVRAETYVDVEDSGITDEQFIRYLWATVRAADRYLEVVPRLRFSGGEAQAVVAQADEEYSQLVALTQSADDEIDLD